MKNFDGWNEISKTIEQRPSRNFHEREIWWCRIGLNIGHEQDGKGQEYSRPILVIKKFNKVACLIVPLTTKCKINKYHMKFRVSDGVDRTAIISQVKFMDSKRFDNKIGNVDSQVFDQIKMAIKQII